MNSSPNYSCPPKTASEANLDTIEESNHEQYEQYKQVFSKNGSREGEFLEKPVTTIHTVHAQEKEEPINQLVEPVQAGMNSLENPQKLFIGDEKLFMDLDDEIPLCGRCLDQRVDTPAVKEYDGVMYCQKCHEEVSK